MSEAEMNGQFESVCESVFSEVESQAMDALDLPGCFRTRSHSYLRAIQAGYSQDDECIPAMTPSNTASTIRSTAGKGALSDLPSGTRVGERGVSSQRSTRFFTAGEIHSPNVWYICQMALVTSSYLQWGFDTFLS